MKTKLVKSFMAGIIGAAMSAISLYGMNPIGMAAFGAIQGSSLYVIPAVPLFLIAIYAGYGLLGTVKYAIVMFLSAAFIVTVRYIGENRRKVNVYISALATGISYGMLEMSDAFMENSSILDYSLAGISTVLVFSLAVVFGKLIEVFLGEDRIKYDHRMKRKATEKSRTEKLADS